MAEKLVIEIYKKKSVEDLAAVISDVDSRLETGSGAAVSASVAAALLLRAAAASLAEQPENERIQYVCRNAKILRDYMVHLIDEDVKSRAPLKRAIKEGGEREIEAARHPAIAICAEIINMMGQCIELCLELSDMCSREVLHYVGESAELALSAMKAARLYIIDMADKCSDDTFRFICRRENEILISEAEQKVKPLTEKIMQVI